MAYFTISFCYDGLDEMSGRYELNETAYTVMAVAELYVSDLLLTEIEEQVLSKIHLVELRKPCRALMRVVTSFDEFRERQQTVLVPELL